MDKKQLNELKSKLPKGWSATLAEQLGVTPATVVNAMNGKYNRFDIIQAAIVLARETVLSTQKNLTEILNELN